MAGEYFQYSVASFATPALAVDHVDATQSTLYSAMQEFHQQLSGCVTVEAVQIQFILNTPFSMAQFAQCQAIQPWAQEFGDC